MSLLKQKPISFVDDLYSIVKIFATTSTLWHFAIIYEYKFNICKFEMLAYSAFQIFPFCRSSGEGDDTDCKASIIYSWFSVTENLCEQASSL